MRKKLNSKAKSVIMVYAIFFVVYVLAFLVIPFKKIAASWISFAFTIIAIVAGLFIFNVAFNTKKTIVSKIYGYPIFKVGVIYTVAQLILGILICAIAAFVTVPYWVALILFVILFGATAIGVIITDNTRDMVEQVDDETKSETKNITFFQINISGIVDCCEDDALKSELQKLNDAFRFSDPVSNKFTSDIEEKINSMLSKLKVSIENNNEVEATDYIKKITNALAERNRICKATKGN